MKNELKLSFLIRHLELWAFLVILLFGLVLNWQTDISFEIGNRAGFVKQLFSFHADTKWIGVFSGMLIVAAVIRIFILIMMQYLMVKEPEILTVIVKPAGKLMLVKLLQLVIVFLIFLFIFRSSTFQESISETWLSMFSTALLIQIFFAALGDSLKQLVFFIWRAQH